MNISFKTLSHQRIYSKLLLLTLCTTSGLVNAEGDTKDGYRLEEVTVTARKREESLQDTPVAVSAFSASALETAGIATSRDLEQAVPGLNFAEMGTKGPSIFIRGIGQKDSSTALDPGVGVYLNSIYIPRTDSQLLDVVDIESVQVLRGPQGTLFGKNNTGGALVVTTRKPHVDGLEGEASIRVGDFGRGDFKASANIPLNDDTLAVRFSMNSTNLDGYLKNSYDDRKFGDEDRIGATGRLLWEPSDVFSTDVFYYWSKLNENGAGQNCVSQNPDGVFNTFNWPGFEQPGAYMERCNASEAAGEGYEVTINGASEFEMTTQIAGLTLIWDYDDFVIKSLSSWSQQDDVIIEDDSDGTNITGVGQGHISVIGGLERSLNAGYGNFSIPGGEERTQYTQEFQISGSAMDDRLIYTTGVFASREEIDNTIIGNMVGVNGYSYKTDDGVLIPVMLGTSSDLSNETYAIFGQFTFEVTDWYSLTLGTRYTEEKRERKSTSYEADCDAIVEDNLIPGAGNLCAFGVLLLSDPTEFYANPPTFMPIQLLEEFTTLEGEDIIPVNGVVEKSDSWSQWTPTFTNAFTVPNEHLSDALDSTLVYLTYSKGFKSGGFEMKGLEIAPFDAETVTNYELGIKVDAFDQRVRFNSAFYYMEYDDIQVRVTEQGAGVADILTFIDNAGKATIKGFEMELTALPTPNLILSGNISYTDASYDEFTTSDVDTSGLLPVQTEIDRSDEDFAAIPKLTYALSAMYIWETDFGQIAPRLSMYYRDELYTGLDSTAWKPQFRDRATIDDVTLWNFRLGFTPGQSENILVTLFVNNLTDENYYQGGFSNTESLGAGAYVLGAPRTYGLEASISF